MAESTPTPAIEASHHRLGVLDGWRGISILLVMATHMLPLGPKSWQMNLTFGPCGMSLFFTLSGFLIASTLLKHAEVVPFLIRRLFRIVPLAVVGSAIILLLQGAPLEAYPPLWFYYWNYAPTDPGIEHVSHFWSLCVEMHFYISVAVIVGLLGRRGLWLLPGLALAITACRVASGAYISINTHHRVDEILTGATLALLFAGGFGPIGETVKRGLGYLVAFAVLFPLFCISCHPKSGPMQYARPYLGSAVVGCTLFGATRYWSWLACRPLRYVAEISYALYVVHPGSMLGWLGSGEGITKYLKRPLSFAITFGLAHLSTYYFERPMTALGKKLSMRFSEKHRGAGPRPQPSASTPAT